MLTEADEVPLVSMDQSTFGSAYEYYLCVCLWLNSRKHRERQNEEPGGEKEQNQISEANKCENTEERETAFLTITCCQTNPIGNFIVVPNKNIRCANSMGNTKH